MAIGRELDRIPDEVTQDLTDAARVADHITRNIVRIPHDQIDTLLLGADGLQVGDLFHCDL